MRGLSIHINPNGANPFPSEEMNLMEKDILIIKTQFYHDQSPGGEPFQLAQGLMACLRAVHLTINGTARLPGSRDATTQRPANGRKNLWAFIES